MADHLTLAQLEHQRATYKKKLESLVRKGISPEEFKKYDAYIRLLDKRIEKAKQEDYPSGPSGHLP